MLSTRLMTGLIYGRQHGQRNGHKTATFCPAAKWAGGSTTLAEISEVVLGVDGRTTTGTGCGDGLLVVGVDDVATGKTPGSEVAVEGSSTTM